MYRLALLCLLVALIGGCSDDSKDPTPDGTPDQALTDADSDKATPIDDKGTLPWPDWPAYNDATPWKCTPGAAGMCDDNKFHHCKDGICTLCPANYVDCDRQGDCECFGACDGDKCVGGK